MWRLFHRSFRKFWVQSNRIWYWNNRSQKEMTSSQRCLQLYPKFKIQTRYKRFLRQISTSFNQVSKILIRNLTRLILLLIWLNALRTTKHLDKIVTKSQTSPKTSLSTFQICHLSTLELDLLILLQWHHIWILKLQLHVLAKRILDQEPWPKS